MSQNIEVVRVASPDASVSAILERHHALMRAGSPEESCHVMTGDDLFAAGGRVFAATLGGHVVGVGAFKPIENWHAELKSMHSLEAARGRGVGQAVVEAILTSARAERFTRISLETGSADMFAPARALYERNGFTYCPPFGAYREDPLSVFMTRDL